MSDSAIGPERTVPVNEPRPGQALPALALLAGLCATTTQRLPGLPVHPAEGLWLVLLAGALVQSWRSGRRAVPALPWLLCLVLAAAAAGIAGADSLGRGLTEWGQLAVQLCVPILVLQLVPSLAGPLTTGFLLGLGANALVAIGQRSLGVPAVAIGGLLGSRVLLAGVGCALAPFACRLLGRAHGVLLVALLVATAALPQSALVLGIVLLLFLLHPTLHHAHRKVGILLCAMLLLAVGLRWSEFAGFARWHDPDGTPRRWVQEAIAAREALHDRPLTGHGFGRYQAVVSSAEYRGELPRPLETKVEPGMQAGYMVLAVEAGLPAALLLAAALLANAWLSWRHGPRHRVAAIACGAVFCLLATGSLLVRGPGFIVGSVLALALLVPNHRRWAPAQLALLVLCLGIAAATRLTSTSDDLAQTPATLPTADSVTVLLAASEPAAMPVWAQVGENRTLTVPDGILQPGTEYAPAVYAFSLSRATTLTLWLRASWHDGCGNSIAASIDDAPPRLVGNDGSYHTWHWVRAFQVELVAGEHELKLHPREDGLALDQLLLTSDPAAHPSGRLGEGGHALAAEVVANGPGEPPALVPRPRRFRFGIGGCYRGGFEAALLRLGLPWGKVNDCELANLERLKTYDVLCLSELKEVDEEQVFPALDAFVRGGGVLVWENHTGRIPGQWRNSQALLPFGVRRQLNAETGGHGLRTDDSPLFAGIPAGTVIAAHDQVSVMRFWGQPGKDWTGHGRLLRYGKDIGAAFYERPLDQGKVYFLALPLSFHTMWKGRQFLPVLSNLLTQIAGDACPPLHPELTEERPERDGAWFGDDFMRTGPGVGGEWTVTGTARCTGEDRSPQQIAFAAQATAPAELTAGNPEWSAYRLSAAVRTATGAVALRATTETDETVELIWDATAATLCLQQAGTALLTQPLPAKGPDAWRQLSLFGGGHTWFGFVDGQCLLRLDSDRVAGLTGRFSLAVTAGEACFDDVAVCPVADLLPGTDRALGEEGSAAAWGGLGQHGIERYTVYSMPWLARASAAQQQALELVLPTYGEAVLRYGDGPGLRLPPSPEALTVALPEAPRRWFAVAAPTWHDYVFPGRLTEWTPSGGNWIPLSRWSCDPEWHWVGTETNARSALWYDHQLTPPYAVNAVLSLGARDRFGAEYNRGRDLNLQLAGDGADLDRGLSVRVMNARDRGIELWRDGTMIVRAAGIGMPSGHTLHHNWYEVAAWVEAARIRVRFEGVTVLDVPLEKPVARGRLAVWTERNSLRVARVTVAGGRTQ